MSEQHNEELQKMADFAAGSLEKVAFIPLGAAKDAMDPMGGGGMPPAPPPGGAVPPAPPMPGAPPMPPDMAGMPPDMAGMPPEMMGMPPEMMGMPPEEGEGSGDPVLDKLDEILAAVKGGGGGGEGMPEGFEERMTAMEDQIAGMMDMLEQVVASKQAESIESDVKPMGQPAYGPTVSTDLAKTSEELPQAPDVRRNGGMVLKLDSIRGMAARLRKR